jgi:hypothetical protein
MESRDLIGRHVARHYVYFCADCAKPLVTVKGLVGFPVASAKGFNLIHFLVVFFGVGKELQQPGFEYVIRKRRFREKLSSAQT